MKAIVFIIFLIHLPFTGCQSDKQSIPSIENSVSSSFIPQKIATTVIPIPQLLKETTHYRFMCVDTVFQATKLDSLIIEMETTFEQIENFVGQKNTLQKINCYLYSSAEIKGLSIQNTDQNSIDFQTNTAHIVFNEVYDNNFLQLENQLLLRHSLGEPKTKALETGLGIYFSNHWQINGYEYWASKLHLSGNMLSLESLLQNDVFEQQSPVVMGAMSGAFAAFLLQHWGKADFLKQYAKVQFGAEEIAPLEIEWLEFLTQLSTKYLPQITENQQVKKTKTLPYFKGFNFAHEGYNIYDGYGSQQATEALKALRRLGSNTVAIVPYSGIRNPNSLQPTDMRLWRRPGTENDESVVHAAFQSKKLGMATVLKPQIWVRGSWPGDVDFNTQEEWDIFFERYYHWMLHYAMLAEIHDFEVLCVGVEFAKATLKHPEKWRTMIHQIKQFYNGSVTYAANWGEEFENTVIWDAVDFIGINCYYPLSKQENPSKQELQKGFETALSRIEAVAKKYDKKVAFTEIGFRSIEKPWINPHHYEWGDKPNYMEEDQHRCYQVVMEALQNREWCRGILWWKWPSYLSHSQEDKTEFAPNGKMAERVVEKWFKE
ncbi:MAG: hypothetical protein R3E32_07310 [Chitinophagales bacterium]